MKTIISVEKKDSGDFWVSVSGKFGGGFQNANKTDGQLEGFLGSLIIKYGRGNPEGYVLAGAVPDEIAQKLSGL